MLDYPEVKKNVSHTPEKEVRQSFFGKIMTKIVLKKNSKATTQLVVKSKSMV